MKTEVSYVGNTEIKLLRRNLEGCTREHKIRITVQGRTENIFQQWTNSVNMDEIKISKENYIHKVLYKYNSCTRRCL